MTLTVFASMVFAQNIKPNILALEPIKYLDIPYAATRPEK